MRDAWGAPESTNPLVSSGDRTELPVGSTDPLDVARAVWADLVARPVPYAAAGSAYLVAVLAAILVAIGWLGGWMIPGMVAENETLMVVGGGIGFLGYVGLVLGIAFVAVPAMAASLLRALETQRLGGAKIGFDSIFSTMMTDAGRVGAWYLLVNLVGAVGMLFLYVPGLIVMALGLFALPMVVLERRPFGEAASIAWAHARAHPGWHLGVWGSLLLAVIILELTIVGVLAVFPVAIAWSLFAYRIAFGEAGAPQHSATRRHPGVSAAG